MALAKMQLSLPNKEGILCAPTYIAGNYLETTKRISPQIKSKYYSKWLNIIKFSIKFGEIDACITIIFKLILRNLVIAIIK